MNNIRNFRIGGAATPANASFASSFEGLYDESHDAALRGAGQEMFEAAKMLKATDPARYASGGGRTVSASAFGDSMKQVGQLLKADLGVEARLRTSGGWDHHQNEGSVDGQLAARLREFSESLSAFWTDMGTQAEDVVVVTMSEFGRTARENGTRGTDHGHANVMFVMGGAVRGGPRYGRWPGLAQEQLNEGRDLGGDDGLPAGAGRGRVQADWCARPETDFSRRRVGAAQIPEPDRVMAAFAAREDVRI